MFAIVHACTKSYHPLMEPIAEIRVLGPTEIMVEGRRYACTIGRGGIAAVGAKREGDLMTPTGRFFMRGCYYRPDRMVAPASGLPLKALTPNDGWCDDVRDAHYNQHVTLPFAARHERLWRDDHVYDLIIPLGYNDSPIMPGLGSAIFMHVMREDRVGTEGCVALKKTDLLAFLPRLTTRSAVVV